MITKENALEKFDKLYIEEIQGQNTPTVKRAAVQFYKEMTKDITEFINICDLLLKHNPAGFYMITFMLQKKEECIDIRFFETYERWLHDYVENWGGCDAFCYRVLNPMLEKYPKLYEKTKKWGESEHSYTRRASLVCLIRSKGKLIVYLPFEWVSEMCDMLKDDKTDTVQKAVGWALKCCYQNYQPQLEAYLEQNVACLSRTAFRYALEHMSPEKKKYFMKL